MSTQGISLTIVENAVSEELMKGDLKKDPLKKLKASAANKMGYRDLVMSTEGISLNIVENAVSEELTKGDLKKAW